MKLIMFVSNAASTAGKPDEPTNVLRLNIPPKSDRADDENLGAFPKDAQKGGFAEFQGLADEIHGKFKAGQRVTVTIEIAK